MTMCARKVALVSIFLVLIYLTIGCAASPPAAPTELPATQMVVFLTETPLPTLTKTAVPTATHTLPPPTDTPTATPTPIPSPTASATASSTATPMSTATATRWPTPEITAVPTAETTSAALSLAELPNHLGQEVTVSGQVVAAASFSQGFKFTLDDGTGRAVLLLWHNVYDDTWDAPKLTVGAAVKVTGKVGQFQEEWQIEPDFGGDVKVTAPGSGYAPPRAIGDLTNHVGEMAQISGAILRLESTSSAVKIFVGDDTGEIVVFVWRTILDRIPNNVALGEPGTRVKINGRVENYRSNLELVPALPYDVEVLP
ncbi:MAG: OB-fold nucleic acid binding domain-containing protein [Chloroflexota bacterium]